MEIAVAVASKKDGFLRHLAIKRALIQARLEEPIYTRLPDGCSDMSGKVVLQQHAVYGLRQDGRQWSLQFSRVHKIRLTRVCSVRWLMKTLVSFVYVYPDDLVVAGKDKETFDGFCAQPTEFPVNDMGIYRGILIRV